MSTIPTTPSPVATTVATRFASAAPPAAAAAAVQGLYYVGTGLWPLFSIDSFQAVTGPKQDLWLVQTFGVLIAVVGTVLLTSAARMKVPLEIVTLGAGTALALAVVDTIFVLKRDIGPIYLADAIFEVGLVLWWSAAMSRPPQTVKL